MTTSHAHIQALEGPIMITGASGFVGANLFKSIVAQRKDVYALVREEKGWRLAEVHDEHIIAADLNDPNAIRNLVESLKPRTVFDCIAYGAYSFEEKIDLIYQIVHFYLRFSKCILH